MSNLVIVAIPDENDRVWKISSEKIPHLTILFLGEDSEVSNLQKIIEFTEHAANTTLRRFYLPVDRRGELGNDPELGPADVLFFKKGRYDYKAIRDFRAALLQDNNIRTAYDSSPQFDGPWQPHLTLGYENRPAKPDETDRDFGFYDVGFNKIAVWVGDFEGPDFLLKDYWDEWDALETVPMDVAMSDIRSGNLEHYGVKGMRWGVSKESLGKAASSTARFVKDVNFESRAESGKARQMVVNAAHKPFKKEDLPAIKARHGDYAKLKNRAKKPLSKEAKAYRKDAREAYIKRLETTANSMTNASGDRQYTIRERGFDLPAAGGNLPTSKYYWDVSSRKVQHADASLDFTTVEVIFDEEGWITETKTVPATLEQTADLGAHFLAHLGLGTDGALEHFGIKGMRWGVRQERAVTTQTHLDTGLRNRQTKVQAKGGESMPAHNDAVKAAIQKQVLKKSGTDALSTQDLRELANRLQVEAQVEQLTSKKGKRFVQKEIEEAGKQELRKGIGKGVRVAAPHVVKKAGKTAATTAATVALL